MVDVNDDLERLELPELPPACIVDWSGRAVGFIRDQVHDYARAAILADRQRRAARLEKAERTLQLAGYEDCGGELWKPPLGKRAQAAKPVGYVIRTEFYDRHDPWIAMRKEPSALGSIPVYAAPVEVTEAMIERAFRAAFPMAEDASIPKPGSFQYNMIKRAIEAALGGCDGH